eukprot:2271822-Pyramimonas_sp.AAC.1
MEGASRRIKPKKCQRDSDSGSGPSEICLKGRYLTAIGGSLPLEGALPRGPRPWSVASVACP